MTPGQRLRVMGATVALAGIAIAGMSIGSPRGRADDRDDRDDEKDPRIEQGFYIAPVPLKFEEEDRNLVGLGSYIVNVHDCNGCHNPGPGNNQFLKGGNPYFGQPTMINKATYLGGGRDFGALDKMQLSAHIISRNLTPDKTGMPEGGRTFAEFVQIIRTGKDLDNLHPTCPPGVLNTGCLPPPFHGELLQVMPWPLLRNLTDHDLRAIYEYLKAIPCVEGPPAPSNLHNDCH